MLAASETLGSVNDKRTDWPPVTAMLGLPLVGGFAVIFHTHLRFTKDMDLFISADTENAKATFAALASFGAPLEGCAGKTLPTAAAFLASQLTRTASMLCPRIPDCDDSGATIFHVEHCGQVS